MNLYGSYSMFDLGFTDPALIETLSLSGASSSIGNDDEYKPARNYSPVEKASESLKTPPNHRHDGTSPLPLGMDWSPPPRVWDGHNTIWPHDSHTGWSYCCIIPSWTILSHPRGSANAVFYRVQIGIQSPEGITTRQEILRRFSDFLNLSSELKKEFPKKKLPTSPSRGLLRVKSDKLLDERRCLLEDWMTKVLSDIELSRSAPIGTFLELEAAARSSFHELNQNPSDVSSSIGALIPSVQFSNTSDVSLLAGPSSFGSDCGNDSAYETSDLGSPTEGMGRFHEPGNAVFYPGFTHSGETTSVDSRLKRDDGKPWEEFEQGNQENHWIMPSTRDNSNVSTQRVVTNPQVVCKDEKELFFGRENSQAADLVTHSVRDTLETGISSAIISGFSDFMKPEQLRNTSPNPAVDAEYIKGLNAPLSSNLEFRNHLQVVIQLDEQSKMNRILSSMQLRLATAKTDMEDLMMRLNQELAVRQYLSTKIKDLEIELEALKKNGKENLQQAVLTERENFTQMLWDMEELRRKCVEMELKLTSEKADKIQMESTQRSIIQENERLYQELDAAQQQLNNLHKHCSESESKSKADVKLLVKEVKSLRSSYTELKQELSKLAKEKAQVESILQNERQSREHDNAANAKLLHECEILRSRLDECSVTFLIEEENKLVLDTSSPSDSLDILFTSDNRMGLLLAEAQLLAQDVETAKNLDGGYSRSALDDLRKLLADVYVDNASLRKQMNAVIRCALQTTNRTGENQELSSPTKTALSKLLDK